MRHLSSDFPDSTIPDMVHADPIFRRKVLFVYGICAGIGLLTTALVILPGVNSLLTMPRVRAFSILQIIFTAILLSPIPAAIALIHIGMKTIRHKSYPYPGMKVMRTTRIVRGTAAVSRGRVLTVLGAVSVVLSISSTILTYRLAQRVYRPIRLRREHTGQFAGAKGSLVPGSEVPSNRAPVNFFYCACESANYISHSGSALLSPKVVVSGSYCASVG